MPLGKLNLRASQSKLEKLMDRVRKREITLIDLQLFNEWALQERDYPAGNWCKDFDTFKAAGHGFELGTFLTKEQSCFGQRLARISAEIIEIDELTDDVLNDHPEWGR